MAEYGSGPAREAAWTAPGRVNLIGDHTDYADGLVLPFAVPLRTTVRATARGDGVLRVVSDRFPDPHEVTLASLTPGTGTQSWAAYVEGAAWVVQRSGLPLPGADLVVSGGVPLGAGLSSSAALVTAALGALVDLAGARWTTDDLARAARVAENEYVGAPVGVMDPWVVSHAQVGHAVLLDTRSLAEEQVPLPLTLPAMPGPTDGRDEPARSDGVALLVVDTGRPHRTTGSTYAERVHQVAVAAAELGLASLRDADEADVARLSDPVLRARARHVVTENDRVRRVAERLRQGDVQGIGALLTASHVSLRDDFAVSTPELDLVVEAGLTAGGLGARLTGAGDGGCALVLLEASRATAVQDAVVAALLPRVGHTPRSWFVVPAAGASREVH